MFGAQRCFELDDRSEWSRAEGGPADDGEAQGGTHSSLPAGARIRTQCVGWVSSPGASTPNVFL